MIINLEKNFRMGLRDKYFSYGIVKGVWCICICKCKEFEIFGGGVDLCMYWYSRDCFELVVYMEFLNIV